VGRRRGWKEKNWLADTSSMKMCRTYIRV
jgi:hypothetical protein